jgi:hypothetical protein|tara:strand:- start:840 stop:950 length:111 start_codon:yes stop_codon:yes gene_type:complete
MHNLVNSIDKSAFSAALLKIEGTPSLKDESMLAFAS